MDTRTCGRKGRAALAVCLAFGLAGCNPVYTIHSIASPGNEPSTGPDISGWWVLRNEDSAVNALRVVEAAELNVGQCRNVTIHSLKGFPNVEPFAAELVADEICFVPVAGHLVAQIRIAAGVQVYQQYLARIDDESASFCGPVWSDLVQWSDDHPEGTAAHGLQFTRRGGGDSTQLFVISRRGELLSYLETRLPAAAKACDERDDWEGWVTYVRLTPPRRPDTAGAVEDPASQRH